MSPSAGSASKLRGPQETALLLPVPGAERAVAEHRRRLDSAAADGIPAHLTVLHPFVPLDALRARDHDRLEALFADEPPISYAGRRTGWFGGQVLYIALDDASPVRRLTEQVVAAFPDHPPYGGAIPLEDVMPHLTIGHDRPLSELLAAEHAVAAHLPVEDRLDHVELWSGPALAGRTSPKPWRHVRSYRLGTR
ncbi:2'-5' RNA ligase family protein [Brachybacterium paraconglomeratum]|uniref:2'-5' RNA ligase family protein n=1 Tax=Brachybacterium sp. GU-2 TaxID=3069708 RepID=UPI00280AF725|nr:2'-5' RNA ligase family protein [Brachybacterium sp. GU-2]WME24324.1 2'-5' RNA ligase family protein [Brachybacterium sp. GU-2]